MTTNTMTRLLQVLANRKEHSEDPYTTVGTVSRINQAIEELAVSIRNKVYKIALKQLGATTRAEDIEQALRDILDSATFDYKDERTRAVIAQAARALSKRDHSMPAVLGAPYKLSTVRQFIQGE
jgi:hypothetical protein